MMTSEEFDPILVTGAAGFVGACAGMSKCGRAKVRIGWQPFDSLFQELAHTAEWLKATGEHNAPKEHRAAD